MSKIQLEVRRMRAHSLVYYFTFQTTYQYFLILQLNKFKLIDSHYKSNLKRLHKLGYE